MDTSPERHPIEQQPNLPSAARKPSSRKMMDPFRMPLQMHLMVKLHVIARVALAVLQVGSLKMSLNTVVVRVLFITLKAHHGLWLFLGLSLRYRKLLLSYWCGWLLLGLALSRRRRASSVFVFGRRRAFRPHGADHPPESHNTGSQPQPLYCAAPTHLLMSRRRAR